MEFIFLYIVFFCIGVSIGSFLNVLIDRIPRRESFIFSSSHCEFCQTKLKWIELIPIFSFLFLGAKCRTCHKNLSSRYILIEIFTGLQFFLTIYFRGDQSLIHILLILLILSCFTALFFSDLKDGILLDEFSISLLIFSIIFVLITMPALFWNHVFTSIISFGLFFFLFIITKGRGMGFGDVKLAGVIGILLGGVYTFMAIYIAFLTGAIVSIILVIIGRRKFHGGTIPFGPFMILGGEICLFLGDVLLRYIRLIINI
ncbi:MAG: prepilin peptidase [Candidatus Levybacteria bacterium]|nr:prepilin peptidase [Candidatus Levybacteria bacterium]